MSSPNRLWSRERKWWSECGGERVSFEGSGRLSGVDLVPSQGSARVAMWPGQVILCQDSQHLHA